MSMTTDQVIETINSTPDTWLERDGKGKGFICPLCQSGSGKQGTGLSENKKTQTPYQYKCFNCQEYGDMIHFVQRAFNLPERLDAIDKAREIWGIEPFTPRKKGGEKPTPTEPIATEPDKVIATDKVYNLEALMTSTKPVIITMDEVDARTLQAVGVEAIALISAKGYGTVIDYLRTNRPVSGIILSLDDNKGGKHASTKLYSAISGQGIPVMELDMKLDYPTIYHAYKEDPDAFIEAVNKAVESFRGELLAMELQKIEAYKEGSARSYLGALMRTIQDTKTTKPIATGYPDLDHVLDGGLYEGLYILGAISSLGKTTFIQQMADQIAQAGHDVLFFSLEMSRLEIMSKSISRHTFNRSINDTGKTHLAKTGRGVISGWKWESYTDQEKQLINKSIEDYGSYGDKIYIVEGQGNIGAKQILQRVEEHIKYTGNTPIVIVDYLQILAPHDPRATDKQNTDKAVLDLKRISRDYSTPVIGISSLNRANYKTQISYEAFKESGAIEYSSDVLIGLQLAGVGANNFDVDEAKEKIPREIELKILKNRSGRTGAKIEYLYYPMFNYFEEASVSY